VKVKIVGGEVGARRLPGSGARQELGQEAAAQTERTERSERTISPAFGSPLAVSSITPTRSPTRFRFEPQVRREFTPNRHVRKPSETSEGDDQRVLEGVPLPDSVGVTPPVESPAALLVITDDPEVRDLLLELAIEEGWGVRPVETEAEAAVAIQAERPGLVLVDLDMESRAGGKFLRTLRRSPHRDIPCFAVTRSNNTMLAVTLDAPVYFKPALDGLPEALLRLFSQSAAGSSALASSITAPRSSGLSTTATPSPPTTNGPTFNGPRRPSG
jgi:CheY-like chemotaxis protein